jgi:glycerol kinase
MMDASTARIKLVAGDESGEVVKELELTYQQWYDGPGAIDR